MKTHLFVIPLVALFAAAPAADAQYSSRDSRGTSRSDSRGGSNLVYEWQGRVDSEIRLRLRGRRSSVDQVGSNERRSSSGRFRGELPRERGTLYVERIEGRGQVSVIQQPNSSNDYTAILRLRDPSGGAANYRIAAYWRSADGTYSNGNGRDRRDDRGRRDADRDRDRRDGDRDRDDRRRRSDRSDDDRWDRRRP